MITAKQQYKVVAKEEIVRRKQNDRTSNVQKVSECLEKQKLLDVESTFDTKQKYLTNTICDIKISTDKQNTCHTMLEAGRLKIDTQYKSEAYLKEKNLMLKVTNNK